VKNQKRGDMAAQIIPSRHTGSCLCKTIQYQVQGQLSTFALCHCENCAKASGSSFMSNWWFEKGVSRTIPWFASPLSLPPLPSLVKPLTFTSTSECQILPRLAKYAQLRRQCLKPSYLLRKMRLASLHFESQSRKRDYRCEWDAGWCAGKEAECGVPL